jgi:hypothetical protein
MYIGAYNSSHSFFSDASPYGFYIFLQPTESGNYDPEYYRRYTIKDVKITGSSGRDYTAIANTIFPITARLITNKEILAHNQHILGKYRTRNVFPFSYEELCMEFTFEIETIDAIESKQIKLTFSPEINWPEPIWQTMAR